MDDKNSTSKGSPELSGRSLQRKRSLEEGPSASQNTSVKRSRVHSEGQCKDGASTPSPEASVRCDWEEPANLPADPVAKDTYRSLHEAIADGDDDLVRRLLQDYPEEKWFLFDGKSALYSAFYNKRYDIASRLVHIGAKIDDSEVQDVYYLYGPEVDVTHVNCLLSVYNKKSDKSCIFRLLSCSQSPQELDGERLTAVISLYEDFFESEIMKLLMKVVESVALDIVYDFDCEDVNRIQRYNVNESEIYGLTLTSSKEIFIGAKALLSGDSQKKAKVYGVVAEELCHLALDLLFENDAKPYREGDSELEKDFQDIFLGVKSLKDRKYNIESVIADVFRNYPDKEWECELIARVPHLIGIYGQESAKNILQESSELSRLLTFYEENVIPKCKSYTDPTLNTKAHRMMDELMEKDIMSYKEKNIKPLREGFPSFREFCVDEGGISIITTNCIKLCILHVYHELRSEYEDVKTMEKKCIFFSRKRFDSEWKEIVAALKLNVWEYLVLVLDKRQMNLRGLKTDYLDHFEELKSMGMNIIIISGLTSLGDEFNVKAVNYGWNDLSEEYQRLRQIIRYEFKGREILTFVKKGEFPKVFSEDDILRVISGEIPEVSDGVELFSLGYSLETYIERSFQVNTVDSCIFESVPVDTAILLSGLREWDFETFFRNREQVQLLKGYDDEIRHDKSLFINNDKKPMKFKEFQIRNKKGNSIWLHHEDKLFYLRNSTSSGDALEKYLKSKTLGEKEMLDFLQRKRIVIISDNAGYGKSTAISSLIKTVQENIFNSWVFRINLNEFSVNENYPLSLANVTEESDAEKVLDYIFRMLKLKNGLEKLLFKEFRGECFIFFDGFDEVASKYIRNALHILSTLIEKTCAKLVITTRKHHQGELEERMNRFSHQLVPFSREDQVDYLEKHWKHSLKYPSRADHIDEEKVLQKIEQIIQGLESCNTESVSEYKELIWALENMKVENREGCLGEKIDALDFREFAEQILDATSMDKQFLQFMGIPLHLFMVGSVYFNGNFNVRVGCDIYSLYSTFIEQKILIYMEEKVRLTECAAKDILVNVVREKAFKDHIDLADRLFDDGKEIKLADEDKELCSGLGIVSIHDGEIKFIHQTFAEFFKAESIRKSIGMDVFQEVLFKEKYAVVKRFLLSALDEKDYENLMKEFLKDLGFLVQIMRRICYSDLGYDPFGDNSDRICSLKIVKKLLRMFRSTDKRNLFRNFIHKLDILLSEEMNRVNMIGGCVTVEMMKQLMNKDLGINSMLILDFVRFSESVEDIKEVLEEFIFKIRVKGENLGNEELILERVSILMNFSDCKRFGLFSYAIWNERGDTFPHLLKYFRDILGEEQFMRRMIETDYYKWQMEWFVRRMETSKNYRLLEEMRSAFGNEMNVFLDNKFKSSVIVRAVKDEGEMSSSFEKAMKLLEKYFGVESLKEVLLIEDFYGGYLVHKLMESSASANLRKSLNLVNDVLGEKMKLFLKSKDRCLMNIFHFAAHNRNALNFDFLGLYLSGNEIKELLSERNDFGRTCLHLAASYNLRNLTVFLNYVCKMLNCDEIRFEEVILAIDGVGNTFLHLLNSVPFDTKIFQIDEVKTIFDDLRIKLSDELLERLLRMRNKYGKTFLQVERSEKRVVIECCKQILGRDIFEELI